MDHLLRPATCVRAPVRPLVDFATGSPLELLHAHLNGHFCFAVGDNRSRKMIECVVFGTSHLPRIMLQCTGLTPGENGATVPLRSTAKPWLDAGTRTFSRYHASFQVYREQRLGGWDEARLGAIPQPERVLSYDRLARPAHQTQEELNYEPRSVEFHEPLKNGRTVGGPYARPLRPDWQSTTLQFSYSAQSGLLSSALEWRQV